MLGKLVKKLKIFYYVHFKHYTPNDYNIMNWRKQGITIGDNCIFCCSLPVGRDSSLLSFGNNDLISINVTFLLHDAAPTSVSNGMATDFIGRIEIGDFCFIGANTTIMPGVSLANYTVVGAGSVVTHSVTEPGLVIAGNPARVVCTVDEYLKKNKSHMVNLDGMGMQDLKNYVESNPSILVKRSNII